MRYYKNVLELVGNTPLVRINNLGTGKNLILAKLEMYNPLSSVKDRIALAMVEAAEKKGELKPGGVVVEPTSGNTGIGLAFVCSVKGYRLILTMPDTMSMERRRILQLLGAEVVLTPGEKGMQGAVDRALEIAEEEGAVILQQFENPANPQIHAETTAREILRDTDGKIDAFVAGVGTGGTITGVGRVLKNLNHRVKLVAVEPAESQVISGGEPAPHGIQGIGAGFIPSVLDLTLLDGVIPVTTEQAKERARELALKEGLFVGISSGAAMEGALTLDREMENKVIVTLFPDTGERYLSLL